ncbi:MAG: type IV toxin-antitoxin system AbiEi family antitoxin domain-containing protein [Acidimicrobiales bacterium]
MPSAIEPGATFSYAEARAAGWPKRRLYALRDSGDITAIGRGLYRWTDAPITDLDLLEIARRAPQATICLASALARHDLTDENPPRIDIALPRTTRLPRTGAPVRWHRFAVDTFDLGRGLTDASGVHIGLYSAERSIIDVFRLAHREGADLANEALRRWVRRRGSNPATLLELARHFPRVEGPIRRTLQILL